MSKSQSFTELIGCKYPLIQGGMAWISDAHMAAAVSNAGGLGVIAAGNAPVSWVKEQVDLYRTMSDKPFGVNLMLLSPYAEEVAQLIVDEKIPVVITGAGNPRQYVPMWKEAGTIVIPVVASGGLAKLMERMGADALIAEGCEAGGHIGELTTMVLVPSIVDAVDIPVIAAGGICDASTVAACFCLGASAVQVGTAFILAEECTAHDVYKQKVVKAKDVDSKVTGRITGHPVRVLRNKLSREMAKVEYAEDGARKLEELGASSLQRAVVEGDKDRGSFMAGQCACRMSEVKPAKDIIESLFSYDTFKMLAKEIEQI